MKYFVLFFSLLSFLFSAKLYAKSSLPVIYVHAKSAVHVRSPQPIAYVDLPKSKLTGDLPLANLLRLRIEENSGYLPGEELGTLSITGEDFLAQFRLIYMDKENPLVSSELEIRPEDMLPLWPARPSLSQQQLREKALEIITKKPSSAIARESEQGISIRVNRILTCADYLFFDLSLSNATKLKVDIESIGFAIGDKKVLKATNFQQFPLNPVFILTPLSTFSYQARNIYVLPKAIFSPSKQLIITLTESQPSSRKVTLKLSYKDVLSSDSF